MSAYTGSGSIPSANRSTRSKMEYMHSYTHVFERDDWFVNLLLGSVCFVIPVIGHLVFMGYQYQVVEGFIRRPSEKIPKFDFNQFTEMLTRGVYPFVVSLVLQFLMVPVFFIVAFLPMAIPMMFDRGEQPIVMMLVAIFIVFATIVVLFVVHLIIGPLMLRAGLSQSFSETLNFRWIRSFVRMMWLEEIMSTLFLIISSIFVSIIGMLMCFVGIYPAAVLVMLAMSHLTYQQYAIFLANGGEPIPLKEETLGYPVEQPANL
ncbi:MAG: DUF4013 domain-containing protein [Pirellulaceae bacterium]